MTTPLSAEYRTPEPALDTTSWDDWGRETPARPAARIRIAAQWQPGSETEILAELAAAFDTVADTIGRSVIARTTAVLRAERVQS